VIACCKTVDTTVSKNVSKGVGSGNCDEPDSTPCRNQSVWDQEMANAEIGGFPMSNTSIDKIKSCAGSNGGCIDSIH
jgi:hypothetical protein